MSKIHSTRPALQATSIATLAALTLAATAAQAGDRANAPNQTASGIWVASGDVNGDGRPDAATRGKLKQNGTTVATAGEVQAPGAKPRAGLLLPAVQKARMQPQAQRSQLKQNGTTVATAGTVTTRPRN